MLAAPFGLETFHMLGCAPRRLNCIQGSCKKYFSRRQLSIAIQHAQSTAAEVARAK